MKPALAASRLILIAAFAGATIIGAASAGAPLASDGPEISSAAKTKQVQKPNKAKPRPRALAARAPQPATFGWRPADPSFDRQGRRYQPPPGLSCPVDLGYGRWASCNDEF